MSEITCLTVSPLTYQGTETDKYLSWGKKKKRAQTKRIFSSIFTDSTYLVYFPTL